VWLLLCSADDRPALWAVKRLEARGVCPLVVLTPELLHYAPRWEHRLGNDAPSSVRCTRADGREIDGAAIRGVLNRIARLPPHLVERSAPADRGYALQEWTAFFTSWLSCLPVPVINLPTAQGLCGAWRPPSEWHWFASAAGLPISRYRQGSDSPGGPPAGGGVPAAPLPSTGRTVFVLDGEVVEAGPGHDPLPPALAEACGRLGALSRTRFISVDLEPGTGRFLEATPRPDLARGGEPLVAALADALGAVA
jgi:hypothetical protein